jgi:hypothetical protein
MPSTPQKTDKRLADAKEVHVSTRKVEDKGNVPYPQGGLTAVRREMLLALRTEEEEKWEDLEFYDADVCTFLEYSSAKHLTHAFFCSQPNLRQSLDPFSRRARTLSNARQT